MIELRTPPRAGTARVLAWLALAKVAAVLVMALVRPILASRLGVRARD